MKKALQVGTVATIALAILAPWWWEKRALDTERERSHELEGQLGVLLQDLGQERSKLGTVGVMEFKTGVVCGAVAFTDWVRTHPGQDAGSLPQQDLLTLAAEARARKFPDLPAIQAPRR